MAASIRFDNKVRKEFANVLKQRVDEYFTKNNKSKYGGTPLLVKAIILLGIYLGGYFAILSNTLGIYQMWGVAALMGIAAAGIGMSSMHDAHHGSFSSNNRVNKIMGFTIELLGGSAINWKIQHNVLHHTYTNIENVDEDINSRALYRFTKGAKYYRFHRFQHIYMFFLYGLMTVAWVITADFTQLKRYADEGYLGKNRTYAKELLKLILSKLFYYGYTIVVPLIVLDIAWWQFLIGFFTLHYLTGFILAVTFQLAHMVEKAQFPEPKENQIKENWFVHQLATTADFAQHNKLLTWYIGGLNYQVEHHLFPGISHVHYPEIAKIVKKTTDEFGVQYNVYKNISQALSSHIRMLVKMGKTPEPKAA